MITLITGVPGSGKTLRAVYLIMQALKEGRPVYSDIDGISIDGVLPAPDDWRETPEGSLVVYDEVQQRWPSTGKPGAAPEDDIRALEIHRHTAHDLIVITQHPTLVHHHVRKLVGQHIHVRRAASASIVTLFTLSEVFDPKDKNELRNTDKQTWRYPKDLFSVYKSATAHTAKFKLPAKFKALGIAIVCLFSFVSYFVYANGLFFLGSSSVSAAEKAQAHSEAGAPSAATSSILSSVGGCMSIDDYCKCWSSDGSPLSLTPSQCLYVTREVPKSFSF